MSPVRWSELRGVIAVALVIIAIAFAWNRIERHGTDEVEGPTRTTSTTTSTTIAPTTTLTQDEKNAMICVRANALAEELVVLGPEAGEGDLAEASLAFWRDVLDLAGGGPRAEIVAVVSYYEDYIETAGPFDYDPARVIVEGDKEKYQQLITRPAPGFDGSRGLIAFGCGVEVPEQPRMDPDDFEDLEDRLLDDR